MLLQRTARILIIGTVIFCSAQGLHAQCAAPISAFPYAEGFEANNGGWTSGGSLSDWVWGTPSKPVITGAATGSRCWNVGGLTGSKYNDGEASWLQSPCFDFTGLQYPFISFSIFWEMERRFDGAGFQYSTDLGISWTNAGSVLDPVNCLNENWFNYSPIQYLNTLAPVRDGWSGNIQATAGSCQGGGGSGGWVIASHTMPGLSGKPNVIFRFIFGAGTVCNNYDGFAVDNILIKEAPPNNASFTYSCSNNSTVEFVNTSDLCPALTWDFGDPASGANNNSTLPNPTHVFSAPGTYTITLGAAGPGNAPSVYTKTITILGPTTSVTANNNCFGDNAGSATVSVIPPAAGPFSYSWNTVPVQNTQTATGLGGGNYIVTVSALNSCTATAPAIITEPAALTHTVTILQPGCGTATGTVTINQNGGTGPYNFVWSPPVSTGPSAGGLAPGIYSVTVTDSKGCFENFDINLANAITPNIAISNKKDLACFGDKDGRATALATGGNAPYTYSWNTVPVQNNATATDLTAGVYTVTVTDNNGCSASTSVQINEPAPGSCGDVYFPNAFTPNADLKNDEFGAMGNIAAISNYLLMVYNRYGELVFSTRNPGTRWNGKYQGKQLSGNYVWTATFLYKGQFKKEEKGSVMIIR